jgi:hypothetical protein
MLLRFDLNEITQLFISDFSSLQRCETSEEKSEKRSKHLSLMLDISDRYVDKAIQNKLKRQTSSTSSSSSMRKTVSFEISPSHDTTDFKSPKREKQHLRLSKWSFFNCNILIWEKDYFVKKYIVKKELWRFDVVLFNVVCSKMPPRW